MNFAGCLNCIRQWSCQSRYDARPAAGRRCRSFLLLTSLGHRRYTKWKMARDATSAQQVTVDYWSVFWQNVVKIFLIDLLGAATVLCVTSVLVIILFAIAHSLWGLRFRPVAESLVLLATIYVAVILITAMKRHLSLGVAITPVLGPQPEMNDTKSAPVADAGISSPTAISRTYELASTNRSRPNQGVGNERPLSPGGRGKGRLAPALPNFRCQCSSPMASRMS
jgi:hypothetical protein